LVIVIYAMEVVPMSEKEHTSTTILLPAKNTSLPKIIKVEFHRLVLISFEVYSECSLQ
jgi:hypothetical protein